MPVLIPPITHSHTGASQKEPGFTEYSVASDNNLLLITQVDTISSVSRDPNLKSDTTMVINVILRHILQTLSSNVLQQQLVMNLYINWP